MVKLSIIIPVYNKGDLLRTPLESVVAQNGRGSFECILVDDGSTDNNSEICDEYAQKYPDVFSVIHQKNAGRCAARNAGLDVAKGEWVTFMDCDDAIMPDYMDEIPKYLEKASNDINVIQFGYCRSNLNGAFKRSRTVEEETYSTLSDRVSGWTLCWNKIYRKSFLDTNGIRFFEESTIQEDTVFNIWCLAIAGRMLRIPYVGYRKYDYPVRGLSLRTINQLEAADKAFDKLKAKLEQVGVADSKVYEVIAKQKADNIKDMKHIQSPWRKAFQSIQRAFFKLGHRKLMKSIEN